MTMLSNPVAQGKRLLLDAALRLMARTHSLSSLGLRELAREAGLNPNTFYRHFQSVDELGLAIIAQIAGQLRQPLRELRREAAQRPMEESYAGPELLGINVRRGQHVCEETVQLFFDFVEKNPDGFIVGMRELYGASPVLRAALREVMNDFARDMAEDIIEFGLLENLDADTVLRVSSMITRQLFQLAQDYLEQPEKCLAIRAEAQELIMTLFVGATVLKSLGNV
jgi:AcrR family transcriptional regulator